MKRGSIISVFLLFLAMAAEVQAEPPWKRGVIFEPSEAALEPPIEMSYFQPPEKKPPEKKVEPIPEDLFARAPAENLEAPVGLNPQMIGDFQGFFALVPVTVVGQATTVNVSQSMPCMDCPPTTTTTVNTHPITATRTILVPVPSFGAFKIADNASPRPMDRVFFSYTYYNNFTGPTTGSIFPLASTQTVTSPDPTQTTTTSFIPGINNPRTSLNLQTVGVEKTFFNGNGSVSLRVPVFENPGTTSFQSAGFGDLSVILKYAPFYNRVTGNLLSGGMVVTTPTGPSLPTTAGNLNPVLLQPFVGYIYNQSRFYFQGFSSVVAPTNANIPSLFFNDVGVGYWLYSAPGRRISALVPTFEAHVTDPLSHRGVGGPVFVPDIVVLTEGLHIGLFRRAVLTVGVATPVTGPRPYDFQALTQFNFRF